MKKIIPLTLGAVLAFSPIVWAQTIGGGGGGGAGIPSITGTANQITQTGSPGATTLSLPANIIPPGTVNGNTVPSASDTFTLNAASQTLTNKTISGSSNSITNVGNTSLTNSVMTLCGNSVALGSSQTATTCLDSISSTRGSLLERGAAGWTNIPPGTSGFILQSQGPGADPAYVSSTSAVSVTAGSPNILINPTPGTGTFTVAATYVVNAQTGTSYTIVSGDLGKLVTFSNGSAVAVTVPQATGATFGAGASFDVQNKGAGTATFTPTTSTVNGAATLTVAQNTGCTWVSDGTNWQVSACNALGGAGAGTVTTTGSPASGNLTKFTGATTISNGDLSGDCSTSASLVVSCTALNASNLTSGTVAAARMPALTGDITTSAGAVATTLATVNSNTGSCGDATHVCQVTLNGKGLTTAATQVAISSSGSVTNVQAATTSPAITVNGGSGTCSTSCLIGIQEALSPNSTHFADASYTIQATDLGTTLPRTNASNMTDTMPDIGTTGFGQGSSVVICTGPVASAKQDTVTAASASKFMYGSTLASSIIIPPGTCAKIANAQNTNWTVSGVPFMAIGSSQISGGTTHAIEYNNGGVAGEVAPVNNAVVGTNGSGVPSESTTLPSGLTIPSPTLTAPALGTVASGDLTSATNYPVASLSGLGANVAAALAVSASGSSGGFCRSVGSACSGQAGGGANVYSSGALTALTAGTYFAPFGGGGSPVATETAVQTRGPAASTVANLFVDLSVDPGNTNTIAITVSNNTTPQSVTCTVTGNGSTNLTCSDTTHSFNPAQGDKLTFKIVNSATYTGTINITATWGTTNVGVTQYNVTVPARQTATSCNTTTSTTCAITDNTQSANQVFAGPTSGGAAGPTFRSLVAADIPAATGLFTPVYVANNFYPMQPVATPNVSTTAFTTTTTRYQPFYIGTAVTLAQLCVNVTTPDSAKHIQLSIYANGAANQPTGAPLVTTASLLTTTATQVCATASLAITTPGIYWMAAQADTTTALFSGTTVSSADWGPTMVGVQSIANLFSSATTVGTTWNTTGGTFGTWVTNPTITEASNASAQMPYVVFKVASVP